MKTDTVVNILFFSTCIRELMQNSYFQIILEKPKGEKRY